MCEQHIFCPGKPSAVDANQSVEPSIPNDEIRVVDQPHCPSHFRYSQSRVSLRLFHSGSPPNYRIVKHRRLPFLPAGEAYSRMYILSGLELRPSNSISEPLLKTLCFYLVLSQLSLDLISRPSFSFKSPLHSIPDSIYRHSWFVWWDLWIVVNPGPNKYGIPYAAQRRKVGISALNVREWIVSNHVDFTQSHCFPFGYS